MSADFIISYLARHKDSRVSFKAARAYLETMTNRQIARILTDLDALDCIWEYSDYRFDMKLIGEPTLEEEDALDIPESALQSVRLVAKDSIDAVEQMWNGDWRSTTKIEVPGYEILIGGGDSWGDLPDECRHIDTFVSLGLAIPAGFVSNYDINYVPQKKGNN